ncbi:hypothetical protein [Neorhizobium alkalisoli]|uniref:hypothetical protein n=1 Tax=Neorhizobium alkalisoli TaxID=528178 RepID=UPI000CF85131|nr:hypothetical protein [Neorhizobium alkalisoli]
MALKTYMKREGHPELEAPATHAGYAEFRQNGINSQLMLKYHLLPMLTCCLQQKRSRDFLVSRHSRREMRFPVPLVKQQTTKK